MILLRGDLYVVGGLIPEFDELSMDTLVDAIITSPFSVIDGRNLWRYFHERLPSIGGADGHGMIRREAYQPYLSPLMYHKGMVTVTAAPGAVQGRYGAGFLLSESLLLQPQQCNPTRTPLPESLL